MLGDHDVGLPDPQTKRRRSSDSFTEANGCRAGGGGVGGVGDGEWGVGCNINKPDFPICTINEPTATYFTIHT